MDQSYFVHLYQKFLNSSITSEELELLFEHFREKEIDAGILAEIESVLKTQELKNENDLLQSASVESIVSGSDRIVFQHIAQSIKVQSLKRRRYVKYIGIAASFFLIVVAGILGRNWPEKDMTGRNLSHEMVEEIVPGSAKAFIKLSDGSEMELNSLTGELTTGQDGNILYGDGETIVKNNKSKYVTVSTPRGGNYKINLPDGTTVWLNSESSIRFESTFRDTIRLVELTGEAYFDVVHKSHSPFLVKQGDHIVRVLGTEFNLKNYGNGSFETTLVRGKVEVQSTDGRKNIVLRPGFQFKLENNVRSVEKVDVMSYVGWKEGVFYFHGLNLPEVLGQIERWYDIEIPKQGIPNVPVYGEIARTTPIGEVLELLTLVTELKFNLRGRRLQISN